jgi:hypothetical protein
MLKYKSFFVKGECSDNANVLVRFALETRSGTKAEVVNKTF